MPDFRKCDIFSLGILTYELMERRRVLSNDQEWHDLRDGKIKFTHPESHSEELKEMVTMMLAPRPEDRPSTSYLLKNHLLSEQEKEIKIYRTIIKCLFHKIVNVKD